MLQMSSNSDSNFELVQQIKKELQCTIIAEICCKCAPGLYNFIFILFIWKVFFVICDDVSFFIIFRDGIRESVSGWLSASH